MDTQLVNLMADLMEKETLAMVKELINGGTDPMDILDAARSAMEIVGKRFEKGEYFIPDLFMAGEMMNEMSAIVKPLLKKGDTTASKGKVLIGTVAGDIHNIGKDIVTFMLDVNGFDVLDLGIDVPVSAFVEKTREFQPQVVGLSGLLTLAFDSMKKTVEGLEQAGLRGKVKVMIGGAPVTQKHADEIGADGYAPDAPSAVKKANELMAESR